jgi:hypothetical protein
MKLETKGGIVVFGDEDGEDGSAVDTAKFVSRREFSKVLEELKEIASKNKEMASNNDMLQERAKKAEREMESMRGGGDDERSE